MSLTNLFLLKITLIGWHAVKNNYSNSTCVHKKNYKFWGICYINPTYDLRVFINNELFYSFLLLQENTQKIMFLKEMKT